MGPSRTRTPRSRTAAWMCAAALSIGVAASCSDDDATTSEAPSTTQAAVELTGDPVRVMMIHDTNVAAQAATYEGGPDAADAAAAAINASGGINGRPIEVLHCDSQGDPNATVECARQAVDDQVVAVVAKLTTAPGAMPVLQEAGIPSIFASPTVPQEDLVSPLSFPINGGPISAAACVAALAVDEGASEVGLLYYDLPQVSASLPLVEGFITQRGATVAQQVGVPLAAPDISAQVATVTDGTDGIAALMPPQALGQVLPTVRATSPEIPFTGPPLSADQIDDLGADADGYLQCEPYRPPSEDFEGGRQMLAELDAAGVSLDDQPSIADVTHGWIAVHAFADVAQTLDVIDAATVTQAWSELTDFETRGFLAPYTTTTAPTAFGGQFPRLFNPTMWYGEITDGEVGLLRDEAVDVFTTS